MTWVDRCQPREAEDPPPTEPAEPTELERLATERAQLQAKVRRGIRSRHQKRILRRIAEITREILKGRKSP